MVCEVCLKDVKPVKIMSIRINTCIQKIGEDIPATYKKLWEYIDELSGEFAGECLAIYHDLAFNPESIDVECCFSVKEYVEQSAEVKARMAEGGLMASTVFKGPYDKIEPAYATIIDWMKVNGYTPGPRMRESYLNDPSMVKPEEFLTEILWPVSKQA